MPAEGIAFSSREDLLSLEEMQFLSKTLIGMGIDKIRLTGGEPFVRKELPELLDFLSAQKDLQHLSITSNATLIAPYIDQFKKWGIDEVNISLDAIEQASFERITRRAEFNKVMDNIHALIDAGIQVKINCVVLTEQNQDQLVPMVNYMKEYPVVVRFLEEMPFNGGSRQLNPEHWNYKRILEHLEEHFGRLEEEAVPLTATSREFKIEGHRSSVGVIPAYSRTFCANCNRLRITAKGEVLTCLYGQGQLQLRELLRAPGGRDNLQTQMEQVLNRRAKDGFEAEKLHKKGVFGTSMTSLGG
jgi:cyclic pyranopterin phosphate synthase